MKFMFAIFLSVLTIISFADPKSESFIIQIGDRHIKVIAPDKRKDLFAILIENRSLSDQIAKFTVNGNNLKFVTVKSNTSKSVEIENKTSTNVLFVPTSPAFQEVELIFGKKSYEIPSKE